MTTPQQPELRRSGRGATDPASAKATATTTGREDAGHDPVPADNTPGHHPAHEQDKPRLAERPPKPDQPAEGGRPEEPQDPAPQPPPPDPPAEG